MENIYHAEIVKLLKRVRPKLFVVHRLDFKNVFGAIGGYIDGRIFVSCGKFGVAFKLPREVLEKLFKTKDAKHLQYFPNGHIKKEYAILSKHILESNDELEKLVDESIKFVLK